MRVVNQKFDGWLFRIEDGWQILGQLR